MSKELTATQLARRYTSEMNRKRVIAARRAARFGGHLPTCWPMKSRNLGTTPNQIAKLKAFYKKHGIKADFNSDGSVNIGSRAMRARMIAARGMFDQDAGYGDPAPSNAHHDALRERESRENFWADVNNRVAAYEREFFGIRA